MKKKLWAAALALCMLQPAAAALAQARDEEDPLRFVAFSVENLNGGGTVTEAVFADAPITLVNLWATWCGFCIAELPDLAKLSDETGGKVQVVSVLLDSVDGRGNRDESAISAMEAQVARAGATFVVLPPQGFAMSQNTELVGLPTTFVVDQDGVVLDIVIGARSLDDWLVIAQAAADEAYDNAVRLTDE